MQMKQDCSGDKLCSKSKLFLIRVLSVSRDSGEWEIIGPGNDLRQVVCEVRCEMRTINPGGFGGESVLTKLCVSL